MVKMLFMAHSLFIVFMITAGDFIFENTTGYLARQCKLQ